MASEAERRLAEKLGFRLEMGDNGLAKTVAAGGKYEVRRDDIWTLWRFAVSQEELRESERWIPVSEKLPQMEKPVWVITSSGQMLVAMRDNPEYEGWCWYVAQWAWNLTEGDFEADDIEVTAWRPLPAPPKEDK